MKSYLKKLLGTLDLCPLIGKFAMMKMMFFNKGLRCRWEDNIKMGLSKISLRAWIGFVWLRIGNGGWHF
jgi:hypothetical protein